MTMFDPCRTFRDRWFEREALDQEDWLAAHLERCPECRAWSQRVEDRERRLAALPAQPAPDELTNAVWGEVAFPELRIARAISSLERLAAPIELDARVAEELHPGRVAAASLGGLSPAAAPDVLERLVEEELADPEGHRAARFVGSLEPVEAPLRLEGRLGEPSGAPPRRRRGLVGATLSLVAVALLVVWALRGTGENAPPQRKLPLVVAESPQELDPLARGLALALGGFVEESR
jgi:hypothetical protein